MAIDTLAYFLTSLIVFFGLIVGMLLIFIAPEEKKPGLKYFFALQCVLISLLVGIFLLFYGNDIYWALLSSVIILLAMVYHRQKMDNRWLYALFGFIIFWSRIDDALFLLVSSILFLYGLASGSLLANNRKKMSSFLFIVKSYWGFIFVANGFYFLPLLFS